MLKKISSDVWKLNVDSNIYFLDLNEKIIIDTGPMEFKDIVIKELTKLVPLTKISRVLFTHLHYDHSGNFDIFPNAKFYASKEEIEDFNKTKYRAMLDQELAEKFKVKLHPLTAIKDLRIIPAPGHTRGSVCFYYEPLGILFSGDTLFGPGCYGRLDLPTSLPKEMPKTLKTLKELHYKILCPGHNYM